MATKLYLHAAANPQLGTFPAGKQSAVTPAWTAAGATALKQMTGLAGVAQASQAGATAGSTSAQYGLLGMFVSNPLNGAQTVGGGSMTFASATNQSSINANFWANALGVYVWRPSTGAIVGTIKAPSGSLGGATHTVAGETTTLISGIPTSAVNAIDGDVIVCEVYGYFTQAAAVSYTATLFFDGTTDPGADNVAATSAASFVQLAETLSFTDPREVWMAQTGPSAQSWSKVVFGLGNQVMVAGVSAGAYSSDNGKTWTASTLPAANTVNTGATWTLLVFNGTAHVAFNNAGQCCRSTDGGQTWSAAISMGATDTWGGVAADTSGNILAVSFDYYATAYSKDGGQTWTIGNMPVGANYSAVVFDKKSSRWIVLNGLNATTAAYWSTDAVTWTASTLPSAQTWVSVDSDGAGTVIAIAGARRADGTACAVGAKSVDGGSTWASLPLPATAKWIGARFGNGRWMLVAYQVAGSYTSKNSGATWTADATLPVLSLFNLSFGNGIFSATGLDGNFANQATVETFFLVAPTGDVTIPLVGRRATSALGAMTYVPPPGDRTVAITGSRMGATAGYMAVAGSGGLPPDPGTTVTIGPSTASNTAPLNKDFQQIYGGYNFGANVWGAPSTTWSQTIQAVVQSQYGVQSYRIDWNFPGSSTNVKTYPNVQMGQESGSFTPSDPRFPVLISDIASLTTTGTSDTTATGSVMFDAAFDLFLSPTKTSPPGGQPGGELMVMHQWNLPGFTQGNSGTAVINGRTYMLQKLTLTNGSYSWPYIAYYAVNQTADIGVDLKAFITHAFANGFFPPSLQYVDMVEAGIEVEYGQGTTLIENYSVNLTLVGGNPPPPTNTWVARGLPSADQWSRVEYGNGCHVAVAGTSKGAYSTDGGTSWKAVSLPVTTGNWRHLVFTGTKHVAIDDGAGLSCSSSDGGKTWGATVAIGATDTWGDAKVDSSGNILAVSEDAINTAHSADSGATWTIGTMNATGHYVGLTWDAVHAVWVVINGDGASTIAATSPDAVTWTARILPVSDVWADVASDDAGNVIAIAGGGPASAAVASTHAALSKDGGATWTLLTLPAAQKWSRINWGAKTWLAVAFGSGMSASSGNAGTNWSTDSTLGQADWMNLGFGNNVFMATGRDTSYAVQSLVQTYSVTVVSPNVTKALSGQRATSRTGLITFSAASGNVSVQMRGSRASVSGGIVEFQSAANQALAGSRMTSKGGAMAVATYSAAPSVYRCVVPPDDDMTVSTG